MALYYIKHTCFLLNVKAFPFLFKFPRSVSFFFLIPSIVFRVRRELGKLLNAHRLYNASCCVLKKALDRILFSTPVTLDLRHRTTSWDLQNGEKRVKSPRILLPVPRRSQTVANGLQTFAREKLILAKLLVCTKYLWSKWLWVVLRGRTTNRMTYHRRSHMNARVFVFTSNVWKLTTCCATSCMTLWRFV